jgi:hypothetical protein
MTITGAINKAQAQGNPYIMRTLPNGRTAILKMMQDGSFGTCYPNGDSYMEHSFEVAELIARNWEPGIIE